MEIHLRRLDYLIREVTNFARVNGFPEVIFLPIDEADDSFQDYENKRKMNTSLLLQAIAKNQAKSLLTGTEYGELRPVDYFCSSSPSVKKAAQGLIKKGVEPNDGIFNMVEMAFRAYDPCFSCATHSLPGKMPMIINFRDLQNNILQTLRRDS